MWSRVSEFLSIEQHIFIGKKEGTYFAGRRSWVHFLESPVTRSQTGLLGQSGKSELNGLDGPIDLQEMIYVPMERCHLIFQSHGPEDAFLSFNLSSSSSIFSPLLYLFTISLQLQVESQKSLLLWTGAIRLLQINSQLYIGVLFWLHIRQTRANMV